MPDLRMSRASRQGTPRSGSAPAQRSALAATRPESPPEARSTVVLSPGSKLGRYVVGERLGQGGMGTVYAGHDPELDRRVALKVVRPRSSRRRRAAFDNVMRGLFGDEPTPTRRQNVQASRLQREARAAASLSHPNVVAIHDVGRSDFGVFIAMELVEGQTLREWLEERRRDPNEVLAVLAAAGRGLVAAHDAGLVHRDFKPDNVMIAADGRVLVLDFGLVCEAESRGADSPVSSVDMLSEELTCAGAVVGTPGYMAPEQCYGFSTDARTDQFAFCVTVWEALVGDRPFRSAIPDLLDDPLEPADAPTMPRWRFEVLRRGLSLEPRHRYASMGALLEAIRSDPRRCRRRRRWLVWLAALGALAASVWPARRAILRSNCAAEAESIASIWNEHASARLTAALTSTGASYGEATARHVAAELDAYSDSWRDARRNACEADVLGADPDGLVPGTMRCLEAGAKNLAWLLEAMGSVSEVGVRGAISATGSLRAPAECLDPGEARRATQWDDTTSEAADAVRRDLLRVTAYEAMGRYHEGLELARDVAKRATILGAFESSAQYRLGIMLARVGQFPPALVSLETAANMAAAEGDDGRAAGAAIRLAFVLASARGRIDEALRWARWAESFLARVDEGDPTSAISLHGQLGLIYGRQGDLARQLDHHRRALRLARAVGRGAHPGLLATLNNLAGSLADLERYDESRVLLEEAAEIQRESLPPRHPDVAMTLSNLARLYWIAGETAAALDASERALSIFIEVLGPDHPQVGESHSNLALVLDQQGRAAQAVAHLEEAQRIAILVLPDEHPRHGELAEMLEQVRAPS